MNGPLSWLISDAWAQNGPSPAGGGISFLIMIAIFFGIMYFLIIRPQQKRAKEHKSLIDSLTAGDEIVTTGGLAGKVTAVDESFVQVDVAKGVNVKIQKHAIASMLPKGTLKNN